MLWVERGRRMWEGESLGISKQDVPLFQAEEEFQEAVERGAAGSQHIGTTGVAMVIPERADPGEHGIKGAALWVVGWGAAVERPVWRLGLRHLDDAALQQGDVAGRVGGGAGGEARVGPLLRLTCVGAVDEGVNRAGADGFDAGAVDR